MVSWEFFSEDLIATILNYLSYQDLLCRQKSILSKTTHTLTQKLLKNAKIENGITSNFLKLYWEKRELENIPIVLYSPNKFGSSLKSRLFNIFDVKEPHQKLFISNIFTNKLSFMFRPFENQFLFVEFQKNKLNYNVYTRPEKIS